MSLISRLLPVANITLDLDVTSKKRVFEHVGLLFENALGIGRGQVFEALFARERLGSTGLGHGIAIPHGRIKGLREAAGAFVRTGSPIPFEAPDGNPVSLIFVLLVPEKATDLHLQILSELAQMFSDKEMRAQLAGLPDAAAVQQVISEWEPHAQVSVAQLFEDNADALKLAWVSGPRNPSPFLDSAEINQASQGLIGHLNLVHPNWIQIFSRTEAIYFDSLGESEQREALARLASSGLVCIILSEQEKAPGTLAEFAASRNIPVLSSPLHSLQIIWVVRTYLGRALAEFVTRHGVFLDVLGMGMLITGESGVGKSELALELISRGSGLVADDVVELYHIAPETLEGRSPELLKDFLEVRGLGMLNIRTIFGETAVRTKKNLKLIVQMEKPVGGVIPGLERLPLNASSEDIMGISIRKVVLPVAAGRNLAVLAEAAVRNYVLQLRGIDSTQEFIQRQEKQLSRRG